MASKKRKKKVSLGPDGKPWRSEVKRYAALLERAGRDDREIARAVFYAHHYGMEAMSRGGKACLVFAEPDCGDWNCLNPEHQILEEVENCGHAH